jgi:hypothetical protein
VRGDGGAREGQVEHLVACTPVAGGTSRPHVEHVGTKRLLIPANMGNVSLLPDTCEKGTHHLTRQDCRIISMAGLH